MSEHQDSDDDAALLSRHACDLNDELVAAEADIIVAEVLLRNLLTLVNSDRVMRASGFAKDARDFLHRRESATP